MIGTREEHWPFWRKPSEILQGVAKNHPSIPVRDRMRNFVMSMSKEMSHTGKIACRHCGKDWYGEHSESCLLREFGWEPRR